MAIEYDKSGKLFQVDYQAPFGGIDVTAYASAIDPHGFVDTDAMHNEDNILKTVILGKLGESQTGLLGHYMGFIPVPDNIGDNPSLGFIITDSHVYPVAYVGGSLVIGASSSYTPALVGDNSYFHYIVINNVQTGVPDIYWTGHGWNEIWWRDGASSAVALLTNYVGGGILSLLDNQLLNLGGYSLADGTVPNRISWSAPGAYGQFQPYDVGTGSGNYAAGFNDLPSISDIITGFAAIGTVGYLFRTEGITQVNVTGNGIEPFQFNHLWASELGIGSPIPFSISQYGSLVCFISDSGIYSLGLNGLSEIGKKAKTYIYNRLNTLFLAQGSNYLYGPQGRVTPYLVATPELTYVLALPSSYNAANPSLPTYDFIAISLETSNVYNLGQQQPFNQFTGAISIAFFNTNTLLSIVPGSRLIVPFFVSGETDGSTTTISFWWFLTESSKTGILTFRKEQMKFGYVPTVTKVAVIGALIDTSVNGTINASVDGGLTFQFSATIVAGVAPGGDGVLDNIYLDAVQSLQRPQLVLQLTNVQIAEAWYQGTLADFPLI